VTGKRSVEDLCDAADWALAVEQWLRSDDSAGYPGGESGKRLMFETILTLGLMDAEDKFAALTKSYRMLKRAGLVHISAARSTNN
jgi:hypothetical protein